jgi:hypothetical protein
MLLTSHGRGVCDAEVMVCGWPARRPGAAEELSPPSEVGTANNFVRGPEARRAGVSHVHSGPPSPPGYSWYDATATRHSAWLAGIAGAGSRTEIV